MGTPWMNSDGLFVRFGTDEADVGRGGQYQDLGNLVAVEAYFDYTDCLSATNSIIGSVSASNNGSFGIVVPKGARIQGVETLVVTAFTSSGTIGSSTMLLGLIKASDRTTELDWDGFLTASFVGSKLDAVGERNYQEVGTTGSGALIGTTLTESGILSTSNSAHGSHPYTAGRLKVKVHYFFPNANL